MGNPRFERSEEIIGFRLSMSRQTRDSEFELSLRKHTSTDWITTQLASYDTSELA